ncbi:MAG: hypothetical protein IJZ68_06070 [Bacteroidaceae bacterium]|nr:hypothetical protein [Bacteroidaceae bacterium]
MNKTYRVTCTGYDLCMHQPCVGRIARNMHGTRIRAIEAAQHAAMEDLSALATNKGLAHPLSLVVHLNDERHTDDPELTNAATVAYVDEEGNEQVYSEYQVWEILERDNTHTNFQYRGFRIEYDVNDKWYWIFYLSNKRNHRWSGNSIAMCCDIIDEVCNEMLMEGM